MQRIFVLLLVFLSAEAYAGLGQELPLDQAFDQLCLLDYGKDRDRYTEICTGILIDQTTVLTAAHCVESGMPQAIICGPQGSRVQPTSVQIHPNFSDRWPIGDVSYLKNDLAMIKLDRSLPAEEVALMDVAEINHVQQCAFFGYSKLSMSARSTPSKPQIAWQVASSALDFWKELGMVRLQGLKAGGGLTELGDSGGPLLCRQKDKKWRLLGIASSRDFAYQAFFTPVVDRAFPIQVARGSELLREKAIQLKKRNLKQAEVRMFSELTQRIRNIPKIAILADRLNEISDYREAYYLALQALFDRPGEVGRLKSYSTFEKAGDPKLYSVGDLAFNYFTVEKIDFERGYVEGSLQVLGPSENFMCHGDLLCRDETIPMVKTRIESLLIFKK